MGVRYVHGRKPVERNLSVGLRILDRRAFGRRAQLGVVRRSTVKRPGRPAAIASKAASAAIIPDFMAAWLPLIREAFRKPASHPISAPPGNTSLGSDCRPPAVIARAP